MMAGLDLIDGLRVWTWTDCISRNHADPTLNYAPLGTYTGNCSARSLLPQGSGYLKHPDAAYTFAFSSCAASLSRLVHARGICLKSRHQGVIPAQLCPCP